MLVNMPYTIEFNNIWHGFDDTLGSIIQAHISNKLIKDGEIDITLKEFCKLQINLG